MLMLWMYLHLISVFIPAYFFPFSKKKWNKHPKFVNTEKWTHLHIQRIDINFDFFHVENKKPTNKEVHNQKKDKLKNILLPSYLAELTWECYFRTQGARAVNTRLFEIPPPTILG